MKYKIVLCMTMVIACVAAYVCACTCSHTKAGNFEQSHFTGMWEGCQPDWTVTEEDSVEGLGPCPSIDPEAEFTQGLCYTMFVWLPDRYLGAASSGSDPTKAVDVTLQGESFSGGGCQLHSPLFKPKYWTCKAGTTSPVDAPSKQTVGC